METLKVVSVLGGSCVGFFGFIFVLFFFLIKSEEKEKQKADEFVLTAVRQLFEEGGEFASFTKTSVIVSEGEESYLFYQVWIVFEVSRACSTSGGVDRYLRACVFYADANSSRNMQFSGYLSEALKARGFETNSRFGEKQPAVESFKVCRVPSS